MSLNHPDLAPAATGTVVSWAAGFVGLCVAAEPLLQVIALLTSIIVGVLTAVWTYKKIRAESAKDAAALAASAVKASAVVAARAVDARAVVVAKALDDSHDG
jgi:hypothetical protein